MSLNSGYICDTNIWVKVVIGDVVSSFFSTFESLHFADSVENEIKKWANNDDKYKKISTIFDENKENAINVIYLEKLDAVEQTLIRRQLSSFGFSNIDNSKKTLKNLGEYVSILYAYFLGIPFLQTDDVEFYGNIDIEKQFSGIEIMTWNDIAGRITMNDMERIRLNSLIEKEQQRMNQKKKDFNSLDNRLEKLRKHFNTR